MTADRRILIVAFDGLRPDMLSTDLTPNLVRMMAAGVSFPNSRACFPTETRVNQASLITGCLPRRHGIVANRFLDLNATANAVIDSGDFQALTKADAALNGNLIDVPTLGEILHGAGRSFAVAGSGTAGGNCVLHRKASAFGHLNISLHGADSSTTPDLLARMIDAQGPIPADQMPNCGRISWLTEAYMNWIAPRLDPDICLLWYSDPDTTFHFRGIGSDAATTAIRHADAEFGRILDWRNATGQADSLQIVALSDHGHVTVQGPPLDMPAQLAAAGFGVAERPNGDGDAVIVRGSCGGIYLDDQTPEADIVAWLQGQDWCGPLFTRRPHGGCFDLALAGVDHERSADIVFITRSGIDPVPGHPPGWCLHDLPKIPEGGSLHGGLTPFETNNMLVLSGSAFASGETVATPAGIVDVAPTLLHLLDIDPPSPMDGRVLNEAFGGHDVAQSEKAHEADTGNGYSQTLNTTSVDGVPYLVSGRRL